jgi:predicted dehydrogenase
MWGILGAGFGLYGHLPAMAQLNSDPVCVAKKNVEIIEKRQELHQFKNRVRWVDDEQEILRLCDLVVVSVWPKGQEYWIEKCLPYPTVKSLILEKPLGHSPENAKEILTELFKSKKTFRINYSFIYTKWYDDLKRLIENYEITHIAINWTFSAHHYRQNLDNWKRYKSSGGSVIRFYGIHLIAVMAALGFTQAAYSNTVAYSEEDIFKWTSGYKNTKGYIAEVLVDSRNSRDSFKITVDYKNKQGTASAFTIDLKDPFSDLISLDGLDPRVEVVKKVYFSLEDKNSDASMYNMYQITNELWAQTEAKSIQSLVNYN